MGQRVDGCVEGDTAIDVPVAIDVLRPRDTSTRLWIIAHEVRDGIAGIAVVGIEYNGALVFLDVVIVVEIERVGKLRLQSRVTLSDVERVRVVGNVEQLRDVGLAGVAAVLYSDGLLVGELIAEVERWRHVRHVADGINVDAAVVLDVVGVLWLYVEADVILVLLLIIAQHETDVVSIVLIL